MELAQVFFVNYYVIIFKYSVYVQEGVFSIIKA